MRDSARPKSWRWLGRLLPVSLRELMYEPLCDDIWRAHVTETARGGRLGLWFRFAGGFAASVGYSLPRYFVERDRVTVLGKAAFVMAAGGTVLVIVALTPWIMFLVTNH